MSRDDDADGGSGSGVFEVGCGQGEARACGGNAERSADHVQKDDGPVDGKENGGGGEAVERDGKWGGHGSVDAVENKE